MSSVFIGTVMMAARIFDAFNDPLMGNIVAKTRTRGGRFRPWIFAGTVLNAVTIYALYACLLYTSIILSLSRKKAS